MHLLSQKPVRSREAKATEPAEHLLRAVGKDDNRENESEQRQDFVVTRADDVAEHDWSSLGVLVIVY